MLLDHFLSRSYISVILHLGLLLIALCEIQVHGTHREGSEQRTSGQDRPRTSRPSGPQNNTRPVNPGGMCGACWTREERKEYDRQVFQGKILQKLRLSQPPNFSNSHDDIHLVPSIQNIINELEQEDRIRRGAVNTRPCESEGGCPGDENLSEDDPDYMTWQSERLSGDGESSTVFTAFHLAESDAPNDPNVLKFDLSKYPDPDLLVSAVLGVHVGVPGGQARRHSAFTSPPSSRIQHEPAVLVTLYRRVSLDSSRQPGSYQNEFLQRGRRKLLRHIQGTCQTFNLTQQVLDWIRHPHTNLGLSLEVTDKRGRFMHVLDLNCSDTSEHRPYLELRFRDPDSIPTTIRPHSRQRRTTPSQDCQEHSSQFLCCRYYLALDFADLGWNWIIAPQRTSAYYCSGQCPYLYQTVLPASHLGQQTGGMLPGAPCCAPTKTSDLKIMYRGANDTILQSIIPGLITDKCGCW